jgi:natural product precursor
LSHIIESKKAFTFELVLTFNKIINMKNSISNFSDSKLSRQEMKDVKGGLIHGACRDGMTFTVGSYDSSLCSGHGGLAYVVVNIP